MVRNHFGRRVKAAAAWCSGIIRYFNARTCRISRGSNHPLVLEIGSAANKQAETAQQDTLPAIPAGVKSVTEPAEIVSMINLRHKSRW